MMVADGTTPRSTSRSFGPTSTANKVTPVKLPLGRFRLVTNPTAAGLLAFLGSQ